MTLIEDRPGAKTEATGQLGTAVPQPTADFVSRLCKLGVVVFAARPGGTEFLRPMGWPELGWRSTTRTVKDMLLNLIVSTLTAAVATPLWMQFFARTKTEAPASAEAPD